MSGNSKNSLAIALSQETLVRLNLVWNLKKSNPVVYTK